MNDRNQIKTVINEKLIETGEKEKLKEMLRRRLSESGWRDEVKEHAKNCIQEENSQITVDELVMKITPKARDLVPETVKRELLAAIRKFLSEQAQS